ncbi:MAG: DnaJ domain-containing protein [Polyangiaceae bacterium]|nr:DnaJ domain-containing protein [Polyangiaceae bacterium]
MLRFILLAIFVFLLYRAAKPYLSAPALQDKTPRRNPPKPASKRAEEERVGGKLPHEVLGVAKDASWQNIQAAYRRLMLEHHPDKANHLEPEGRALAAERAKDINRAYELLGKRRS